MVNAIVLLGYSGVGKDTIANLLISQYANLVNVKFSGLTKDLLASAFRVPRDWLDGQDREPKWREQNLRLHGVEIGITPLDLLVTLYRGAGKYDKLHQANIKYALDSIPTGAIPVFTDVRRSAEMCAVYEKYGVEETQVIYLSRSGVSQGLADDFLDDLYFDFAVDLHEGNPKADAYSIATHLKLTKQKPTLHICFPGALAVSGAPYEPLSLAVAKLMDIFNISQNTASALLILGVTEIDLKQVEITPINQTSFINWLPAHEAFLDRWRQQANIRVHGQLPQVHQFTKEELS